jgi:hypothetical protein
MTLFVSPFLLYCIKTIKKNMMATESDILTLQADTSCTDNISIVEGKYSTASADSPTTRTVVSYGTINAVFATYYVDYKIEISTAFAEDVTINFNLAEADDVEVAYSGTLAAGSTSILLSELDTDYSASTLESREDADDTIVASISEMPIGSVDFTITTLSNTDAGWGTDDIELAEITTRFRQGRFDDVSVVIVYDSELNANSVIAANIARLVYGSDNCLIDVANFTSDDFDSVLSGYAIGTRQRVLVMCGDFLTSAQEGDLLTLLGDGDDDDTIITEYTVTDRSSTASAAQQAWVDIIGADIPLSISQVAGVLSELSADDITDGEYISKTILAQFGNIFDNEISINLSRMFDIGWFSRNKNNIIQSGSSFATVDGSYIADLELKGKAIQDYITYLNNTNTILGITTSSLTDAENDAAYSVSLASAGGIGDYTYTVSGLPTGLSLSGSTISGTPYDSVDDYTVTIGIEDAVGNTDSTEMTLALDAATGTDFLTFDIYDDTIANKGESIATGAATIDASAHTIAIEVESGTDLSSGVVPIFTSSYGSTVATITTDTAYTGFEDGVAKAIVITAEDSTTTQSWDITVVTVAS